MKKIDGDLKAVRDNDERWFSILRYVVLDDKYNIDNGIVFLQCLKRRRKIVRATGDGDTDSLSFLLLAACGNRTVVRCAAARSALTPMH